MCIFNITKNKPNLVIRGIVSARKINEQEFNDRRKNKIHLF